MIILKGILIGIANIIPGVSGGTIAVVIGLYEPTITAISSLFTSKEAFKTQSLFLLQLGLGAAIGIVGFSYIISALLTVHPQPTYYFFIGLILGSIPVLYKSNKAMNISPSRLISGFTGILIMILITFPQLIGLLNVLSENKAPSLTLLFISGIIAAGTMIIPGVSGSMMLLILGTYTYILNSVKSLSIFPLLIVAAGATFGITLFAKVIHYCLTKNPGLTHYFILGLLLGSIPKLFPGIPENIFHTSLSLLSLASGFLLVNIKK